MFSTFKVNLLSAVYGQCWATAPAPTGSAVTDMDFWVHLFAGDANVTAKTSAPRWLSLNRSIVAHECYPLAPCECRVEC